MGYIVTKGDVVSRTLYFSWSIVFLSIKSTSVRIRSIRLFGWPFSRNRVFECLMFS